MPDSEIFPGYLVTTPSNETRLSTWLLIFNDNSKIIGFTSLLNNTLPTETKKPSKRPLRVINELYSTTSKMSAFGVRTDIYIDIARAPRRKSTQLNPTHLVYASNFLMFQIKMHVSERLKEPKFAILSVHYSAAARVANVRTGFRCSWGVCACIRHLYTSDWLT